MSREFLARAQRLPASLDSDTATADTVRLMCQYSNASVRDPLIQAAARSACEKLRGGPLYKGVAGELDARAVAGSCWWFVHLAVEFVHHDSMIAALFGERDQQQLLISPDVVLRMKRPAGDCAIFTMLCCSLLKARGVQYEVVTCAVDPSQPEIYSHVFARAVMPDGTRIPLDASHGQYPGWQVPAEHRTRTQVWDESGNPIEDAQPWGGLHGYTRRGVGYIDPETGVEVTFAGADPNTTTLNDPFGIYGQGTPTFANQPAPTFSAPAGSGSNWGNWFQNLSGQALNLVGKIVAPTTTLQRGPNGQLLYSTPGSGAGSSVLATDVGGGFTGSTLLWVGIGGLALFVAAKAFGGKR